MSEHKNYEHVGKLAEEYSQIKGELDAIQQKINEAKSAYTYVGQLMNNNAITLHNGALQIIPGHVRTPGGNLNSLAHLMNKEELLLAFERRQHLIVESDRLKAELRVHAPHLL